MSRRALTATTILGCLVALVLADFGDVLLRGRQFAYRDSGLFFYPLYKRVQEEWAAGRWPLWEPYENGGTPLLGNPAAAVLYPGKLIYAALPYPWAARIYVVAHVVLAFAAAWALLRHWAISPAGAAIGALSYAFSDTVVFQYSNVLYLVGSAWIPLGFLAADAWLRLGWRRAPAALAAVLTMEVLCGDIEAAYVIGACALAYALYLHRGALLGPITWRAAPYAAGGYLVLLNHSAQMASARRDAAMGTSVGFSPLRPPLQLALAAAWGAAGVLLVRRAWRGGEEGRVALRRLAGLVLAAAVAGAACGVQLLPSLEFSGLSDRASSVGQTPPYRMATHPYRLVELAWPNVFGLAAKPGNIAWLGVVPPLLHDRQASPWTPSLYLGALPIALALSAAGFGARGGPAWRPWLTAIALIGLLGSLNEMASPIYWLRSIPGAASVLGGHDTPRDIDMVRIDGGLNDPDGGPYWLLASTLPGFATFRFPSKLLTFSALAVAGLAGLGWDRLASGPDRRAARIAAGAAAAGVLALIAALALGGMLARHAPAAVTDFGPLDLAAANAHARRALVHGIAAALLACALALRAHRGMTAAALVALIGLSFDLALAGAPTRWSVPQSAFETTPRALAAIEAEEKAHPSPGPYRIFRASAWSPTAWQHRVSPDRHEEALRWERDTLQPRFANLYGLGYALAHGTANLFDYDFFFTPLTIRLEGPAARALNVAEGTRSYYFPRRGFDLWGARYFILPTRIVLDDVDRGFIAQLPRTRTLLPEPDAFEGPGGAARREAWTEDQDVQVLVNRDAYPRAWVVHRALPLVPIKGMNPADRFEPMSRLLYKGDGLWVDPKRSVFDTTWAALVEVEPHSPEAETLARRLSRADPDPSESVTVVRNEPQRVELKVTLKSPGLVILADVYYPGWRLAVDGEPAPIYRTNRMMRGAALTAGAHSLVYTYEPNSFRIGGAISLLGLAGLAALGARGFGPRPTPREPGIRKVVESADW